MKRQNIIITVLLITIFTIVIFYGTLEIVDMDQDNINKSNSIEIQNFISVQKKNNIILSENLLDVQFIPQAPFHNWGEPWQNACEEAAILNSYYYLEGRQNISNDQIRDDIKAMIIWQLEYFDKHENLNLNKVAIVINRYLGYDYNIIEIKSMDDIKQEIDNGNPVIIPAAGRILKNEHFTQPAPIYHMLTAIGYIQDKIITNDPGTQFGRKLKYSYNNLYESIHDWVEGAEENPDFILKGKKVGIVLVNSG